MSILTADRTPTFPPLMQGHAVDAGIDPVDTACAMACFRATSGAITNAAAK